MKVKERETDCCKRGNKEGKAIEVNSNANTGRKTHEHSALKIGCDHSPGCSR